ncbi:helix-turn-helix domain-containing protein [Paracraurococcus lichenis]|uniref:Helix-turn-helix domain-containing protein n=1 Tax=Paracraurococcus lichenis TaxID=3064888 RepID=A0ABT9E032_9PROT|nr:helix-turn-helix domain-containing protein [Paracraurococcus sp. LOR1-02]MDO9709523.1 helix-turn-helix domain-containing protein [Paracraurococcus sp. LOR1-02]
MQRAGAEFHRFTEPGDALRAMPGMSLSVVPVGTTSYEASLATIRLGDAALNLCHSSPFMAFATTDADAVTLQFPVEAAGSLVLNGVTCRPGTIGVCGEGAELLLASRGAGTHAAIVLPSRLAETLLGPRAGAMLWQPGRLALLQAAPEAWERARQVVGAAGKTVASVPQVFGTEQPRQALREALLQATRDLVSGEGEQEVRAPRSTKARRRIVMAADAYLRENKDRPIYTEDLCDALAVSASSLADAFRAMFDISPHRFLKLRRLSMIRAALLSHADAVPLVKSVALSHGFWHLGQFAADYRATFGESPSETLARAGRRVVPDDADAAA